MATMKIPCLLQAIFISDSSSTTTVLQFQLTYSFTASGRDDDLVDSPVNGNEVSTGAGGERRGNYCTMNPLKNSIGAF